MPYVVFPRCLGFERVFGCEGRDADHALAAMTCRATAMTGPAALLLIRRIGHCGHNLSRRAGCAWHDACSIPDMIRKQRKFDSLCAVLLAMLSCDAFAQALQPVEGLRALAADFVQQRLRGDAPSSVTVVATATALDSRLRLPLCAQKPQAFAPGTELRASARITIGVRCEQPTWTVYVPVNVETELPVLVLRQAVARNTAILPQDVEVQRRKVPGAAASYITNVSQLQDRHLKMTAAAGTALTVDLLVADVLIRRGQRVTLVAAAGGLEVRAQGEALADAQPSGRVQVLNLSSHRPVEGQVESRDVVRVTP